MQTTYSIDLTALEYRGTLLGTTQDSRSLFAAAGLGAEVQKIRKAQRSARRVRGAAKLTAPLIASVSPTVAHSATH
jgi:hypothetical protein